MSIYRVRYKRSPDDDAEQPAQPRVGPAAGNVLRFVPPGQNLARLRKASPVDYLLPASIRWLTSLPHEVRVAALASKYPRIVNLIARHWNDYDACCACFADLLADRRGTRRGFPADVHADIRNLQEYYLYARQSAGDELTLV